MTLGYEYIAITDHSPHSGATRNLTVDGVETQAEEIAALRERYPRMTMLHGCEVDILVDGRLDFRDSILERSTSCWHRCTNVMDTRPNSFSRVMSARCAIPWSRS